MVYFFRRAQSRMMCETRLSPAGPGYELVVTTDGVVLVESFTELAAMLAREHELLQAWRATGWREGAAPATPTATPDNEDWLGRRG